MGGGWKCGEEEANRLVDWAGFKKGKDKLLLDLGSGDGDFLLHLQDQFTCIGIDLSTVGVDFAKKSAVNAEFHVADIETYQHLPLFDYLATIGSIEHVIDLDRALKNCYKLLKDDGLFLALVPNELWIYEDQPQEQTHTDEEWAALFTKAGFKVMKQNRRSDLTDFLLSK
jgi:SAM-dependent methyltransferase